MIQKYKEVNDSFSYWKLIFHLGCDSGFYSEFNNMVLAMIYCLKSQIRFSMYSADANFGYKDGWQDYFLPFCEEVNDKFHHKYNARTENPWFSVHGLARWEYLLWRLKHKHTYLTIDLFCKFRQVSCARIEYSIPQLELKGDLRTVAHEIIKMIYRFNPETLSEIRKLIQPLDLPDKYIGFHIRGGDKFTEHELLQCSAYIDKAEKLSLLRKAFVLTDDYRIIETLKQNYPQWRFYSLTESSERGYFHAKFQSQDKESKKKDLIKLFASMEILRMSELFVGTFSSNVGMFLGMCMEKERAYGVDFDEWLLW